MYAVYHGPEGLRKMLAEFMVSQQLLIWPLKAAGLKQVNENYFDTLKVAVKDRKAIEREAIKREVNFRYLKIITIGIALDEITSSGDLDVILEIFAAAGYGTTGNISANGQEMKWPASLIRKSAYLTHPVFNMHHSEHEMLRYIKRLENKDLSMVHSMISLGSCTMKLNATSEMIPVTWPELGNIHPFTPSDQTAGYQEMISALEEALMEITWLFRCFTSAEQWRAG
jgi:glycine dehydrogenase